MRHIARNGILFAGLSLAQGVCAVGAQAEPRDESGYVGQTSYWKLPFESNIYQQCWNCSVDEEPAELFFSANPASPYLNASMMAQVRGSAAYMNNKGVVPAGGAQRWEDTYEASFPAGTFPAEPSWIKADRTNGNFPNRPEFVAWRNFINAHQSYQDVAYDGGTMPNQSNYFRAWGGQWGHLSPLTPLNAADCPPDMQSGCTWGDSWAYRWSLTTAKTGGYGIMLSDFTDSQPYGSNLHDFNPGIVAAFAARNGMQSTLAGMTAPQSAAWINTHMYPQWNDFLDQGYANYYKAMVTRISAATGNQALVIDQCSLTPAYRRSIGTDERMIAQAIGPASYMCIWDDQVIQNGRGGPMANGVAGELAGAVVAAAREPIIRNGANLEAADQNYWSAIASYYPTLNAASQQEVGYKLLKRIWTWESWAHIATRQGLVRRALAFTSRDYWDAGTLTALNPLTSLIQTINPVAPFGPALYYSTAVERQFEATEQTNPAGGGYNPYLFSPVLSQFIDNGGGFGYYVSDAALPLITTHGNNAPSAWYVVGAGNTLPAAELATLQATAPVVTTPQAFAALPNQPIRFSAGLTGFAFRDLQGRVIVVVTNPSPSPTAVAINGSITLTESGKSSFTITDLMTNGSVTLPGTNGTVVISGTVARWDTMILAITAQ